MTACFPWQRGASCGRPPSELAGLACGPRADRPARRTSSPRGRARVECRLRPLVQVRTAVAGRHSQAESMTAQAVKWFPNVELQWRRDGGGVPASGSLPRGPGGPPLPPRRTGCCAKQPRACCTYLPAVLGPSAVVAATGGAAWHPSRPCLARCWAPCFSNPPTLLVVRLAGVPLCLLLARILNLPGLARRLQAGGARQATAACTAGPRGCSVCDAAAAIAARLCAGAASTRCASADPGRGPSSTARSSLPTRLCRSTPRCRRCCRADAAPAHPWPSRCCPLLASHCSFSGFSHAPAIPGWLQPLYYASPFSWCCRA